MNMQTLRKQFDGAGDAESRRTLEIRRRPNAPSNKFVQKAIAQVVIGKLFVLEFLVVKNIYAKIC